MCYQMPSLNEINFPVIFLLNLIRLFSLKMEIVEGEFPHGDSTIAMLSFESLDKAKSWVGGAEKVMNTDWLGTADIISVPVKNPPGEQNV